MKLIGVLDVAKRWNYTRQGVHRRVKRDKTFPKPIAVINDSTLVFLEADILDYEAKHKEVLETRYKRVSN